MSTDAGTTRAGDDVTALFRTLHASLGALLEDLTVGGYDPRRVRTRIAGADATLGALEEAVEASFSAAQGIVDALTAGGSPIAQPGDDAQALEEARESIAALIAARDLAADRYDEALEARDRAIASLHEGLTTVHAELLARETDADAARAASDARVAELERAIAARDAVIQEMHHEIADVHAEALEHERERDAGRTRLTAIEDQRRLLQLELAAARAEAERFRGQLRDALEATRTGRMTETMGGWLPLTGRLERPGGGRLARKTSEHGRRVLGPTRPVAPVREDASPS